MNKKQTTQTYHPAHRVRSLVRSAFLTIGCLLFMRFPAAWAASNSDPSWSVKTIFGVTINSETALQDYVGVALNGLYSIIGSLTLLRIFVGAYKYMSAAGNPEAISDAKNTIRHALTGLVMILLAYTLTSVFLDTSLLGF